MQVPFEPSVVHQDGFLAVSGGHQIYWQQLGNPNGKPVFIVHGGPGTGINPDHRRFLDNDLYNIIAFDQRGSGRSLPTACLESNTTWDLIDDIESLRCLFGFDQITLFAASWGSALSLLYAQHYPDRVKSLFLRSIFLAREQDVAWLIKDAKAHLYDFWQPIAQVIDEDKSAIENYKQFHGLLTHSDPKIRLETAAAHAHYFGAMTTMKPHLAERMAKMAGIFNIEEHLVFAQIQTHYSSNMMFLGDYDILENMHKIQHIPGYILHGRFDMVCPVDRAFLLHQNWPKAELKIIPDAGHKNMEGQFPKEILKRNNAD